MVASTELNPVPPSSNPYIAPLTGPYGFRAGYVVTYALQGNPGDTSPMGGALWAQANAAQAFQLAAEAWAAVANIKIIPIATGYDGSGTTTATWVEKLEKLDENILGEHALPGTGRLGGSFSNTSPFFTGSNNAVGGYSFVTFLHEIGHGLGLLHPHGEGDAFPGVAGEHFWGDNGLNQLIYTVMSYNDGLEGDFTSSDAFGWSQTPMAFDIAAIQHIYGANLSTATGDSVYRLPAVNGAGVGWTCIWDAGGIDTISAAGTEQGTTIDLRPASLLNEANGGGFLSRIAGVSGGFTIANGVVIENAIGSMGGDVINGNERGNHLTGNGGYDVIEGFGGDDWIEGSGRLSGGNGDDRMIASGSGNNLSGGEGADYLEGLGYLDGGEKSQEIDRIVGENAKRYRSRTRTQVDNFLGAIVGQPKRGHRSIPARFSKDAKSRHHFGIGGFEPVSQVHVAFGCEANVCSARSPMVRPTLLHLSFGKEKSNSAVWRIDKTPPRLSPTEE